MAGITARRYPCDTERIGKDAGLDKIYLGSHISPYSVNIFLLNRSLASQVISSKY